MASARKAGNDWPLAGKSSYDNVFERSAELAIRQYTSRARPRVPPAEFLPIGDNTSTRMRGACEAEANKCVECVVAPVGRKDDIRIAPYTQVERRAKRVGQRCTPKKARA